MVSKTAMLALVKAFDAPAADRALKENPALKAWRDERGRNWLHVCCAQPLKAGQEAAGIATAKMLLRHGYDMSAAAFMEGDWKATPVWYCISRGRNLKLAEFLLNQGADPNHALWAASFNEDRAAIRLLVKHGADLEAVAEDSTPLLGAVSWSKFGPAEELLKAGANPDAQDSKGRTALHMMVKKASAPEHFAMFVRAGARGDIKDGTGVTVADALSRKRDPAYQRIAAQLKRAK